jgi:hypothetical protein
MNAFPIRPASGDFPTMCELSRLAPALAEMDATARQAAIVTRAREDRPRLTLSFGRKGGNRI